MSASGDRGKPGAFDRSIDHLIDFVDTAAVGLHWVGADGTILWANRGDYEPLGYTADEYIGHHIAEFHADPDVIADILARLGRGERLHNYEARLKCKDGGVRFVQISSSVLFEDTPAGRQFVHTRCYTLDVTDRKRLEQARDRFVSILGHDLRNPLSSVAMAAEVLLHADDIPTKHHKQLERIARAAARMSRMITDLIDFARTLGDGMPLKRKPVHFGETCQRILEEVEQAHPGARIELTTDGDLRGEWDADRLAQAIANLLGNAVQHGSPPVRVTLHGTDDHVRMDVANGGPPIATEAIESLFEPFSHTSATDGLGLGLFIVSEIVKAHGGSIEVQSGADHGTVFTSRWPKTAGARS